MLVDAERRIEARIAERVPPGLPRDLEHLLEETVDTGVTRFVWLRHSEPSDELTFQYFAASLNGRVAALVRQDEPGG